MVVARSGDAKFGARSDGASSFHDGTKASVVATLVVATQSRHAIVESAPMGRVGVDELRAREDVAALPMGFDCLHIATQDCKVKP